MANENCLQGMKCPCCGSEGPFIIHVTCDMEVEDDGWDMPEKESSNTEWGDSSYCRCKACDFFGIVGQYKGGYTKQEDNNDHVCPECDHKETLRLELIPGISGVIEDDGYWEYDGNGTDFEYDDQLFSGIWRCPECNHEWGKLEEDLLEGLVGKAWVEKPRGISKEAEVWRHFVLNWLIVKSIHHPIDAVVDFYGDIPKDNMDYDEAIAVALCEIWMFSHQPKIPRSAKPILNMVREFYPPGHRNLAVLDRLEGVIERVVKERRPAWESGTRGQ